MMDRTVSRGDGGTSAKGDTSLVGDPAAISGAGGEFEPASGPDREFVGATGVRAYVRALGPGLITGASDDDPSGIATYAQAGARFGFSMLWVALLTLPLMMGIQEICDRTALASGKTLGELITVHFGRVWRAVIGVLIAVLVVANALNIAADLVAVGQGMQTGPVNRLEKSDLAASLEPAELAIWGIETPNVAGGWVDQRRASRRPLSVVGGV
jgi:hypothetical protein